MTSKLDVIARQLQSWLDWQEQERAREGIETTDDTHIMRPPVWPTRGTIKAWIKALQEADPEGRAAHLVEHFPEGTPFVPIRTEEPFTTDTIERMRAQAEAMQDLTIIADLAALDGANVRMSDMLTLVQRAIRSVGA